jgi:hypothetical protein
MSEQPNYPLRPFDWVAFRRDQERQKIETARRRRLQRQIIEAGYRSLATKLHPDVGGSSESMARLSEARDEMTRTLGLGKPRPRARHTWTFEWRR